MVRIENKYSKLIILLLSILLIVIFAVHIYSRNYRELQVHLSETIAHEILSERIDWALRGGNTANDLIIIHVENSELPSDIIPISRLNSLSYVTAWKYQNDKLILAERVDFIEAVKEDVYIILFAIRSLENEKANVDVFTSYGFPYRGGGFGSHWNLSFDGARWHILEKEEYINWN